MLTHDSLYTFWLRSQGIWFSKLVNVTIKLLECGELLANDSVENIEHSEFGIRLGWEYNTKSEAGQMLWWTRSDRPGLIFTNKGIGNFTQPATYTYSLPSKDTLITSIGQFEETNILDGDNRRLRELRFDGKLMRRHYEQKFKP